MKYLKIIGLAAVAAMTAVAVIGAGTAAAATELCKENTKPCPEAKMYATGAGITGKLQEATKSVLTTSGGLFNPTVTCTGSTLGATTTATSGATLPLHVSSLTFSGCTASVGGGKCMVVSTPVGRGEHIGEANPWPGSAVGGLGSGPITVKEDVFGTPGAKVECEGLPTCTYTASSVTLEFLGGSPAQISAVSEPLSGGAFPCPPSAKWTASYTVSPSPMFLVG